MRALAAFSALFVVASVAFHAGSARIARVCVDGLDRIEAKTDTLQQEIESFGVEHTRIAEADRE